MPFCPNCGIELSETERFCSNCGTPQGFQQRPPTYQQPPGQQPYQPQQAARVTTGHQYNEGLCVLLCCCMSPVVALIYYLITNQSNQNRQY
ncbi:MAG: zinc-ribbon domain-containing protein [Candidatus Hodarchaeales archaeon]|jgi:predicted amidophosphoribosyltransferase